MQHSNLQTTIDALLTNPKILSVDIFYPHKEPVYASIHYSDKNGKEHAILIDVPDMHSLLAPFSITSSGRYEYVRLQGKYLHQLILPAPRGYVTHHVSEEFTLDNRSASLQLVPRDIHLQFHRQHALQRNL